jgi:hypothetical protein
MSRKTTKPTTQQVLEAFWKLAGFQERICKAEEKGLRGFLKEEIGQVRTAWEESMGVFRLVDDKNVNYASEAKNENFPIFHLRNSLLAFSQFWTEVETIDRSLAGSVPVSAPSSSE